MSFLKKWAAIKIEDEASSETDLSAIGSEPEAQALSLSTEYGPGRPSLENAARPIEERRAEALELAGELNYLFNERAAILEYEARLPREEAERIAMIEVKASETYRCWRALG
jgi:hypothetical protein